MSLKNPLVSVGEVFWRGGADRKVVSVERMPPCPHFGPSWGYRLEGYPNLVSEGALLGESEFYRRRDAAAARERGTDG